MWDQVNRVLMLAQEVGAGRVGVGAGGSGGGARHIELLARLALAVDVLALPHPQHL